MCYGQGVIKFRLSSDSNNKAVPQNILRITQSSKEILYVYQRYSNLCSTGCESAQLSLDWKYLSFYSQNKLCQCELGGNRMLWGHFMKWQNQGFAAPSSLLKNPDCHKKLFLLCQCNFHWFQCIRGLNSIYTANLIGINGLKKILLTDLKHFSTW